MKEGPTTVSAEHWERVDNLRVHDVVHAALTRPERLYPHQKFTPTRAKKYVFDDVPKEENTFTSIDDALAAIRKWCG